MNGLLTLLILIVCTLIVLAVPGLVSPSSAELGVVNIFDTGRAVLLCAALSLTAAYVIMRQPEDGQFLVRLFALGVLIRVIVGTAIFVFQGQEFFGGDALTYDFLGAAQLRSWGGDHYFSQVTNAHLGHNGGTSWGMVYLVAGVYAVVGRNALSVQFVNAVLGAATAPIIYLCALQVFNNLRVARISALAVAFFPSLILWSSQGLKDGPIVFFLALSILATLKLSQKFEVRQIVILIFALFAILSLRFYVFYMITVAVAGTFVVGTGKLTSLNFVRQFAIIIIVGLALTYAGITRYAVQLEHYTNLERIQISRLDAAKRAQSGFGVQSDVSTSQGALATIPLGMVYLLFAPFPWQLASLRQSITLPEMLIWWASFPLLILGLWFSIKYRLRQISPILIFTVTLSIAYAIFQGNVGNAYRQRSQLLVFYFIFVAVGYVFLSEKRAELKRRELAEPEPLRAEIGTSIWSRR
ncbi:MAG TPA: glycosyltransferase family 39 protein [Pyrinomonadaceae bacterium]|nr:glycosyltransferase family 39 protein [Pyrinomonadaceae bacterium]